MSSSPHRAPLAAGVVLGFALLATAVAPAHADVADVADGAADVTGPVVQMISPNASISDGLPLRVQWSGTDPAGAAGALVSGVASYDVRYRQADSIVGPRGPWVTPDAWQATTATTVTLDVPAGLVTCVQVRAQDVAGNVGDWAAERCTAADSTPPSMIAASAGPIVVAAVAPSTVTLTYRATDDLTVASYDVYVRTAPLNGPLGGWTAPAGFVGRTTMTATYDVPVGGQMCFAARARDGFGHLSGWSDSACATVPVDDATLRSAGRVTRISTAVALGGTASVLQARGAEVSLPTVQTGTRVGVVVLRGPGQGSVDVYAGTTRLGRIYLAATAWRRDTVVLPVGSFSRATIRLRSSSTAQARIDAVAVIR